MIKRHSILWTLCCVLVASAALDAQELKVINTEGRVTTITASQITSLPHVTADVIDHNTPAKFEGVPLSAVLALAGIQLGDTMRGPRLTEVLLVGAADGYHVAYALAETDPAFAVHEIILADKRDGKPLAPKEGPSRIVAPGDKRPARWIRQVTEMKIIAAQ